MKTEIECCPIPGVPFLSVWRKFGMNGHIFYTNTSGLVFTLMRKILNSWYWPWFCELLKVLTFAKKMLTFVLIKNKIFRKIKFLRISPSLGAWVYVEWSLLECKDISFINLKTEHPVWNHDFGGFFFKYK